ncbi:MAG: hypothetical protein SV377_01185 [Halobacteria archaeon]|nr:hypothetical protein [Halobacteria archaeon]
MVEPIIAWAIAVVFYGIGDVVSTVIATRYESLEESMGVPRRVLGPKPSLSGLIILKLFTFALVYGMYITVLSENQYRDWAPIALGLIGLYATTNNFYKILLVRGRN